MTEITVFGEDSAHEVILRTLLERLAAEYHLPVEIHVRSATGGHARMIREVKQYLDDLKRGKEKLPDLFIVARDANCEGYAKRVRETAAALEGHQGLAVHAIPDPHIERWLLIDSRAFKQVLGHGCQMPDLKCDRARYKEILDRAVRNAGVEPLLGGVEFAEDIIRSMNLKQASRLDDSFRHLLSDLQKAFRKWTAT